LKMLCADIVQEIEGQVIEILEHANTNFVGTLKVSEDVKALYIKLIVSTANNPLPLSTRSNNFIAISPFYTMQ
jgi:hypothetical protein